MLVLREMKVMTIKSRQLGVLQRQRVVRISRNNNILADLRRMGEDARETIENARAELNHVVAPSACDEILDHVVPEIRSKYKGIGTPIANKEIITGSACQRVAAGRAQDRTTRACNDVARYYRAPAPYTYALYSIRPTAT